MRCSLRTFFASAASRDVKAGFAAAAADIVRTV
jgi:hypothetical protein